MGFLSVNEQMDLIRRGAEEIIPEEELVRKLERSKSKDITLMSLDEYKIYIDDYIKKSKYPDLN